MKCNFQPEGGKEPYIFVSYCHRNEELVVAILNRLHDAGFRIWYDEGIEWGSEWPHEVEKHLLGSQVCLAFLSREFVESKNCRQEVHFALDRKGTLLPVYLEEVKLEYGLGLRMSLCHAINYWKIQDKEKFYRILMNDQRIQPCRDREIAALYEARQSKNRFNLPWLPEKKENLLAAVTQQIPVQKTSLARSGFHYFCTDCGGKVNDDTVLFDLSGVLDAPWEALTLHLTEEELRTLQRENEYIQGRDYRCTMTLGEILTVVSNPRNLDDPVIAELTEEEIRAFLAGEASANAPAQEFVQNSRPLQALRKAVENSRRKQDAIGRDLQRLMDCLDAAGNLTFRLELAVEKDSTGADVVTGLLVNRNQSGRRMLERRVCPHCRRELYRRAGTAEHKVITFLGERGTGKSSILQALLHYATHHMQYNSGHPLWQQAKTLSGVGTVEVLRAAPALSRLDLYEQGASPVKTTDQQTCGDTSITLRIREKKNPSAGTVQETILTLVELPGDLCDGRGVLDRNRVVTHFPIVLESTILAACMKAEDSAIPGAPGRACVEAAQRTGLLADQFQNMLMNFGGRSGIPTMLLFTACPELEAPGQRTEKPPVFSNPVQNAYLLNRERLFMEQDEVYRGMIRSFSNACTTRAPYQAELRCSAFGPGKLPVPLLTDGRVMPSGPRAMVRPANVDFLMWWLLMASGCIRVNARQGISGRVDRDQFRTENPNFDGNVPLEAVLRCSLFSNPGIHDTYLVQNYGDRVAAVARKMTMKPNSNDQPG